MIKLGMDLNAQTTDFNFVNFPRSAIYPIQSDYAAKIRQLAAKLKKGCTASNSKSLM
jgi:hypothetical protein